MSKWDEFFASADHDITHADIIWRDAEDLARLSIESLAIDTTLVRRDRSRGSIRLTGTGVQGHSVRVDSLTKTLANFQRLVLASGMALEGHRSLKGQPPPRVLTRTRLRVEAAPSPGSLVVAFVADSPVEAEIAPDGQPDILGDESTLLDRSIEKAIGLLATGKEITANADDSEFIELIEEAGPRVASTLRDLVESFIESSIEPEIVWMQPRTPKAFVSVALPELLMISKLVAGRSLDRDPVELEGILHTVSDMAPLKVTTIEGETLTVEAKELPFEDIRALNVGDYVRIKAEVTEDHTPGGEPVARYTATSVEKLVPPRNQ
ncbi:hypothetical protein [Agromyces sp. NPDC055658]